MLTVEVYSIAMYSMTSFSRAEPILPSRLSTYLSIYTERMNLSEPWVDYIMNISKKACIHASYIILQSPDRITYSRR